MIPKFRVWCKNRKEWERDVCYIQQDGLLYQRSKGSERLIPILSKNHSVMQSTDLKDKNGVEIYEGDIVHIQDSEQINQRDESGIYIDAFFEEIDEIDFVVFADGCFKLKRTGFDVCICRSVEDFKVIGNIYENPELLEAIE